MSEQLLQSIDKKITQLDKKVDKLDHKIDSKVDQLDQKMDQKITQLDKKIDAKIDQLDQKMSHKIDSKIDQLDKRMSQKIDQKVDQLDKKVDTKINRTLKILEVDMVTHADLDQRFENSTSLLTKEIQRSEESVRADMGKGFIEMNKKIDQVNRRTDGDVRDLYKRVGKVERKAQLA